MKLVSAVSLTTSVLLELIVCIIAKDSKPVKFPKDQRMDIRFPPKIELPNSPSLPIGHLRPIGHQQRSRGQVLAGEASNWKSDTPLLFEGLQKTIFTIWDRERNSEDNGNSTSVIITRLSATGATKYEQMKLSKFLDNFGSEEWILDQILSPLQLPDLKIPEGFQCLSDGLLYISSSLTSGATSDDIKTSPLHKLQCVLSGRRDYIVINKENKTPIITSSNPQAVCDIESIVNLNPDIVNVFENPWIISMTWQHATLRSGDCILLPAGSVLHTTSYGECETVTFNWRNKTTCGKASSAEKKKLSPLLCSNAKNQDVELCDRTDEDVGERWRRLLMNMLNKDHVLTKSCFIKLFGNQETGEKMFHRLFYTNRVTADLITKLSSSTLKMLNNAAEPEEIITHVHDEL